MTKTASGRYFGPEDTKIRPQRAAELLGLCAETVRRYTEKGLLRGCQAYPGAHLLISKLSVLEYKARLQAQVEQVKPLPWRDE